LQFEEILVQRDAEVSRLLGQQTRQQRGRVLPVVALDELRKLRNPKQERERRRRIGEPRRAAACAMRRRKVVLPDPGSPRITSRVWARDSSSVRRARPLSISRPLPISSISGM
jgi:hypothetical protein